MKKQIRKNIFRNAGLLTLISTLLTFFIFSCDKYQYELPTIDPDEEISFQEDILAIFEDQNCAGCHPRSSPPNLNADQAYESLLDGYVNTDSPEDSEIYTQFEDGHVGLNTNSLEIQKILSWIKQGAKNN